MSTIYGKLCCNILRDHFGEIVEKVGNDLFCHGQKPLRLVCGADGTNRKAVRQALCILIQHGLVTFHRGKTPESAEYLLHPDKILLLLQYSKYLLISMNLYGKEAETMIDEILRHGCCTFPEVIVRASARIQDGGEVDKALIVRLRDLFEVLVNKQYIQRCPTAVGEAQPVPVLEGDSMTRFAPPKSDMSVLLSNVTSGTWDRNDPTIWSVNHCRFQQDMRDELLVSAMSRRVSKTAGDVLGHLLRQAYLISPPSAPQSNPVLIGQFREHCRKAKMDVKHLDDYLSVMVEDECGFISRDDLSNGAYIIQMKHAVEELTWSVLASAVEVRYSSSAARIFRLIREQEYIEQDEIQKRAMLPDKECKLLTYTLVQNGWVQQQELKKGVLKSGPTKTFYLFCIDLNLVVRMYLETCYKGLVNCAARREYENDQNSILLNKKQRIDTIVHHLKLKQASEEDIAEVNELLTPPEAALLEKIHATLDKLHQAELEIDGTLFILQLYLEFKGKPT